MPKAKKTEEVKKSKKSNFNLIEFFSKWVAILVMAVLAFAGVVSLLDGVDKVIVYITGVVLVAFLTKEIV
jgi:hypothetical protein